MGIESVADGLSYQVERVGEIIGNFYEFLRLIDRRGQDTQTFRLQL